MLAASEEQKKVFPEQPLVAFRRASNLKDNLNRAKLPPVQGDSVKGCFRCGKSMCQVCKFMFEGDKFVCHVTGKEYNINSRFDCDSSIVVFIEGHFTPKNRVRLWQKSFCFQEKSIKNQ